MGWNFGCLVKIMRLVLFDIDGTLIEPRGVGTRAMVAALSDVVGKPFLTKMVLFAGRTDQQIIRDLFIANGLSEADIDRYFARVTEVLPRYLQRESVRKKPYPLPGVLRLLEAVEKRNDFAMGLVTGNLWVTARLKLEIAEINPDRFSFGAYGSDALDRNALPPIALRRAAYVFDRTFASTEAIVVGDTPADIECAKVNHILSLAVATGHYSLEELKAHNPDYLFEDLRDFERVVEVLTYD